MTTSGVERVHHVKDRILAVREILANRSFEDALADIAIWPAFERHLEVISEASRHIPAAWKATLGGDIPWHQVADLGNVIRHGYHHREAPILWSIYLNDLDPLEAAIDRMLAAHGKL